MSRKTAGTNPDLLLVGGGLANALIAWRLGKARPEARLQIIERASALGGNHTWSFHAGDLSAAQRDWIEPLIVHRWPRQQVRFPAYERTIERSYFSLNSARLHEQLTHQANLDVHLDRKVITLAPRAVELADGCRIQAGAVIDGRGPGRAAGMVLGFQKFVGQEFELDEPHGIDAPVIMDATVAQTDGYRFVYLLPFDRRRILIEDTRYSDGDRLSSQSLRRAIADYTAARGWRPGRVLREEQGVLPILLAGDFDAFWPPADPVARSGLAAGLFHPTTGYSLPMAVGLADEIAARWPLDGPGLAALTRKFAGNLWLRTGFFRRLNRMLFRAGRPEQRYRVLERFYRLDDALIERFYAARPSLTDRARMLAGKPPVPLFEALRVLDEGRFYCKETPGP